MKRWVFFLLLSGCTLGPDPQTPQVAIPSQYEASSSSTEMVDLSAWWEELEDPLLTNFIQEALSCNYDLQIAIHKIEEVRALYRIDRSKLYPQIQGNFEAFRSRRSQNLSSDVIESAASPVDVLPTDFSGPLVQSFFQMGFDASWELDFFGKNRRKEQAAYYDFQASQDRALGVQILLASDVARSYIEIRSLQQRILAKKQQIERQRELLDLARSRYQAGLVTYLDVTRADSALDQQLSTLPLFEEALTITTHALAVLLGKNPENFTLELGWIPKGFGKIPCNLPSDLLLRRPDIRQAERELLAATARIGVAKAELFPSFSLTGNFGTQSNAFSEVLAWPSRFWTVGPTLIWNLFMGGKLVSQIQVTTERQKQAILQYEKVVIEALKEVEDRLTSYFKQQKRLESLEEQIGMDSLTRDLSLEQYRAGLISFDEVLDAEKTLYQTQETLLESQTTIVSQLVGLYKALGGGWKCTNSL